jgi:hypothetical protein
MQLNISQEFYNFLPCKKDIYIVCINVFFTSHQISNISFSNTLTVPIKHIHGQKRNCLQIQRLEEFA